MRNWLRHQFTDDQATARTIAWVGAVGGGVGFALVLIGTIMMRYSA